MTGLAPGTRPLALLLILAAFASTVRGQAPVRSPYTPGPGKYPRFAAKEAEPGLSYGSIPGLPLPRTVLYSVTPEEILADGRQWKQLGVGAFFLQAGPADWSGDIWAVDGEPWTLGKSDKTFQKTRQAVDFCRSLGCEAFLTVSFSHLFDWFDDLAWPRIEDNFRQFAMFARQTGCTGLALDIEYVFPQYHYSWAGYTYDGYSRRQLFDKMQSRMTAVARAMYDAYPEMVLLTFPEQAFSLGNLVHTSWIEEAARRGAPGGVHICTEYTYRRPNIRYMFGHAWMVNQLIDTVLSANAKSYWHQKCSLAAGLWPLGPDPDDYHGAEPIPAEFRQAVAASLMVSRRYNWIYSHNLRPAMLGKNGAQYTDAQRLEGFRRVLAAREVVTDERYVRLAREIRNLQLRDYSRDLGLTPVPSLAAPREEVEIGLMPTDLYQACPVANLRPALWNLAASLYRGEEIDLGKQLNTQTLWMLAGPFANPHGKGFATPYGPEQRVDPQAEYDGLAGRVHWGRFQAPAKAAAVDLSKVFQPNEQVCAYAMCFVHSDAPRQVQIGLGANDQWKLWVGGRLVGEDSQDGRIILDREIIPVRLRAGTTPVLLKVCNSRRDWGFIFRITDSFGQPVPGVSVNLSP